MTLSKYAGLSIFPFLLACQAQIKNDITDDLPRLNDRKMVGSCTYGPTHREIDFAANVRAKWSRAHLSLREPDFNKTFLVQILNETNEIEQTIPSREFEKTGIWTVLLSEGGFTVRVIPTDPQDTDISVCLDYVNVPSTPVEIKSITGLKDERVDLVDTYGINDDFYKFGRSVSMIRFLDPQGGETNCSGVFIKASIVATNNHCVSKQTDLRYVEVILNHESHEVDVVMHVTQLLATDESLDYSLLKVDGIAPYIAAIGVDLLPIGTPLIVIQHPGARSKMISVSKCRVESVRDKSRPTDFFHLCDTSGGSSGSPVMSARTGVVYGLHHLGLPENGPNHYHNLAVYMSDIFSDLRMHHADTFTEISTSK